MFVYILSFFHQRLIFKSCNCSYDVKVYFSGLLCICKFIFGHLCAAFGDFKCLSVAIGSTSGCIGVSEDLCSKNAASVNA